MYIMQITRTNTQCSIKAHGKQNTNFQKCHIITLQTRVCFVHIPKNFYAGTMRCNVNEEETNIINGIFAT